MSKAKYWFGVAQRSQSQNQGWLRLHLKLVASKLWVWSGQERLVLTLTGILQGCCNSLSEGWKIGGQFNISMLFQSYALKILPQLLGNHSSLTRLYLYICSKLMCLPSADALKRLAQLEWLGIVNTIAISKSRLIASPFETCSMYHFPYSLLSDVILLQGEHDRK